MANVIGLSSSDEVAGIRENARDTAMLWCAAAPKR
jgi:hypothetical protein